MLWGLHTQFQRSVRRTAEINSGHVFQLLRAEILLAQIDQPRHITLAFQRVQAISFCAVSATG